ncbi:hypothetical protein BJ973_003774 [Actinoplanes tereljensis]|uniref:DUF4352 domain-containing protein n=1 Tax=Paractinoplanes tereljensis TaxID=571912 RepID=A0A919NY63_9ACTN|nr:DUF4352 domain-containing protein [Actinoplanes tereljensis]GIF25497.1 hypothetical protein Ate02nite_82270 [Actinoplanes tereljensis]
MAHDRRAPLNPLLAVLFAVGAVAVLFLAGLAAQRYGSKEPAAVAGPAATTKATKKAPTTPPPPGVGDPVRDGKFEFVVSRVDCSRTKVGLEHLEKTAKGKYCVVSLSVRNIADESQYFLGRWQKAFDAAGTEYGNDEIAGVYANHDTQTFLKKLSPGDRVEGKLVFDVPKATRLTSLELHDSLLSGGVKVTVAR